MAALVAKDVLKRVRAILQDAGSVRWTLQELTDGLNDGLLEICFLKPSACAQTIVLSLQQGTFQTLAENHSQLIRVIRNITSADGVTPRVSGPVITPIEREILDQQISNWHDSSVMPFSVTVRHIITDPISPRDFYVFPGNNGSGRIEAVVAVEPTKITVPSPDPNDIDEYTDEIGIAPIYQSVLIDYMLYRAFSKDMQMAGAAQRAMAHYQNFNNALGVRRQIEGFANPDNTQTQPNS